MILKSTLLAVVVFLGSLTVAEAQSYFNGGQILGWGGKEGDWAFNHVSSCPTFSDGTNTWYYAFFENNGGFIVTNNPGFAPIIAAACQSGNLFGLVVIEYNPFVWKQIATFPSK